MHQNDTRDAEALHNTIGLVSYLADLTNTANLRPVRDIVRDQDTEIIWIDELPSGVSVDGEASEKVLTLRPVPKAAPPALPAELHGLVDPATIVSTSEPGPRLSARAAAAGDLDAARSHHRLEASFRSWLEKWRAWAETERVQASRRALYSKLESAAKQMEQHDDEYEFVLATGLVSWTGSAHGVLCRHLLTESHVPSIDGRGTITVTRVAGKRRVEDREIFSGLAGYHRDRARSHKDLIVQADGPLLTNHTAAGLHELLSLTMETTFTVSESRQNPSGEPQFSPSPAFVLRRRSSVLVSEAYERIAAALREPGAEIPVALAQLVNETDREQRDNWLQRQGATRGDLLGADPLFPLPANDDQARVLTLLRSEPGVVVQGPPGTGKTHTITNLISALLAQGQRVLVTSQKDQALKVLREKIPADLRKLCVLLAGGSKDAAVELRQGLDGLSDAISAADPTVLRRQARELDDERTALRSANVNINTQIEQLRASESLRHPPVVPEFSSELYCGTLAAIVTDVKHYEPQHYWIPDVPVEAGTTPPLDKEELRELIHLLNARTEQWRRREHQLIPTDSQLCPAAALAELIAGEQAADQRAGNVTDLAAELSRLPAPQLATLHQTYLSLKSAVTSCDLRRSDRQWAQRAINDRLRGENAGLWAQLSTQRGAPDQLLSMLSSIRNARYHVKLHKAIGPDSVGTAKGWLRVGRPLLDHLSRGGSLGRIIIPKVVKDAQPLLDSVEVDGSVPNDAARLNAALDQIEAEVAAIQLAETWRRAGVIVDAAAGQPDLTLSELANHARLFDAIDHIAASRDDAAMILAQNGIAFPLYSLSDLDLLQDAVTQAGLLHTLTAKRAEIQQLQDRLATLSTASLVCPEVADLLFAVQHRDSARYADALARLDDARTDQQHARRTTALMDKLRVHPELLALLENTYADPQWLHADLAGAWAWSLASQFVHQNRSGERELELCAQYRNNEMRIQQVTARLVALQATAACLDRLTDENHRALHSYKGHMAKIGAGGGRKTSEYRRAARAAMLKAQVAVPAWVVPLPNLLENLPAERNRFDVVIVDEASQVGIEHLYLLWMAPRVIVVGDEKQCTPGLGRLKLDEVFARNAEHLRGIDDDVRINLTPKSNLYEALSARAGKDSLVRLREHFRCVPEIINWSSRQFYSDGSGSPGLIPLRQKGKDSLQPLRVTIVEDAYAEGQGQSLHNPLETKRLVETLAACIEDPAYKDKTFGVVVLRSSTAQVLTIEQRISEALPPEVRHERKIRVGKAADFQGDERHVIFLSLVVTGAPRQIGADSERQAFNVATTRAQDQLWLFTSVQPGRLKPNCLRRSLLDYMLDPPPIFGPSQDLDDVPEDTPAAGFGSLLEQRVFREIRRAGYHVISQFPVGGRLLDLVVAGAGGRIAVECDGDYWHRDTQSNDARRDSELARMGWTTVRVRESEFIFDRAQALAPVWKELHARKILPQSVEDSASEWNPVELTHDADSDESLANGHR